LHSTYSDAANPGIKATLNLTDQYKKEIPNTTDLRAVEERASLLTNKESNVELNNSNFSNSGSEYNSSSGGSESRKNWVVSLSYRSISKKRVHPMYLMDVLRDSPAFGFQ
jgi:hypothetical protein